MEKLIVDNNFHSFINSEYGESAKQISDWFSTFSYLDDHVKKAIAEKVYQERKTLFISEYCIYILLLFNYFLNYFIFIYILYIVIYITLYYFIYLLLLLL